MIEKPLPTTFEELQARREELERSARLNKFNMERTLSDASSELPKFLLKKVAMPVALTGLAILGISKLTESGDDVVEVEHVKADGQREVTYQKVEKHGSPSFMTKMWLFAAPFIQSLAKDFVKNRFSHMTSPEDTYSPPNE